MDYNKIEDSDKVSWNMADNLMKEIGSHLGEANNLLVMGNPKSLQIAFRELLAVKRRIIQSLDKDERKLLTNKEKRIKNALGSYNHFARLNKNYTTKTQQTIKYASHFLSRLTIRLEKYNELLMDLLEKYGYLVQKQKDTKSIM